MSEGRMKSVAMAPIYLPILKSLTSEYKAPKHMDAAYAAVNAQWLRSIIAVKYNQIFSMNSVHVPIELEDSLAEHTLGNRGTGRLKHM